MVLGMEAKVSISLSFYTSSSPLLGTRSCEVPEAGALLLCRSCDSRCVLFVRLAHPFERSPVWSISDRATSYAYTLTVPHYCRRAVVFAPRFDGPFRFGGAEVVDPSVLTTASSGCGSGESWYRFLGLPRPEDEDTDLFLFVDLGLSRCVVWYVRFLSVCSDFWDDGPVAPFCTDFDFLGFWGFFLRAGRLDWDARDSDGFDIGEFSRFRLVGGDTDMALLSVSLWPLGPSIKSS